MFDIGVNLTSSRFDKDRDVVITDAKQAGLTGMLVTGTNLEESQQAAQLAAQHPAFLYATAGVHPHDAKTVTTETWPALAKLYDLPQVKAIGECGLDFNRDFSPRPTQQQVFEQQLAIACDKQMPLFMHERDAHERFIDMIKAHQGDLPPAVLHCFTGTMAELEACLDLGLYIGITGWICDERRGTHLIDAVRIIPDNRLLLETDSPYLLPRSMRPKPKSSRNMPQYLPYIAETIAHARSQTLADLVTQTQKNTVRCFGLSAS
ncbi:TatD family hydrolase [Motilimonas pumila]|uniref:Hydrolase TatD n=1 Tax=Motilimonas pumila TaxID=2303987 RepID=A0A418YIH2_9GAMM|nr:TatD family hydrolase [Motilimonas pumila]RJG50451.1 hydrolase TatD [Motilimonas pumila]